MMQSEEAQKYPSRPETIIVFLGLSASLICITLAGEGIIHFDDLTHYLYAKWAWRWPQYLLDDWGRPGFTALYFLPAALGWTACRIVSAVLTAAAAWLACGIARKLDLRPVWPVALLAYLQPLFFQLSQTTLTETALAFYLTLAIYLAQRDRWTFSAAIISLGFVTRHEAVLFLPIWLWYARRERVALWRLWPIIWAPLVVNGIGVFAGTRPPIERLFEPKPSAQYGAGGWLTFFCRSMEAFGPGISILAIAGFVRTWRRPAGAMTAACIGIYFLGQTAIRALGLYDSGGYARFLVPISPLIAVSAFVGWRQFWSADQPARRRAILIAIASMLLLWIALERQIILYRAGQDEVAELPQLDKAVKAVRISTVILGIIGVMSLALAHRPKWRTFTSAAMPAVLAVLIALATASLAGPLSTPEKVHIVRETIGWLREHGYADCPVLSAHVWIDYATRQELPWNRPTVRDRLMDAPPGTLFIWEYQFAGSVAHGIPLDMVATVPAFRRLYASRPLPYSREPYLHVFEKVPLGIERSATRLPIGASVATSRPSH